MKRVQISMTDGEREYFDKVARAKGYPGLSAMLKVTLYQYVSRYPVKGLEIERFRGIEGQPSAVRPGGTGGKNGDG